MEGKSPALSAMVMGVLLIGLFLASAAVDAKSCCKDTTARNCYNVCRLPGTPRPVCAATCNCKIITGSKCPKDYPKINDFLNTVVLDTIIEAVDEDRTEEGYANNDFCKLGCSSSVCGNIIALQKSADLISELEEVVKEAAKRCNDVCSQFCNKKSDIAVVAAK